ncbi:MAG: hypothetical protein IPL52_07165 [Flavobacteriales bacterium]|nr:hypothetical protein [Flavobacteriales bacterium]
MKSPSMRDTDLFNPTVVVAVCASLSASMGQAKECTYKVTVAVVNAVGEQFALVPLPGSTTSHFNYGTIQLSAGAIVRVVNGFQGDPLAQCNASCQRDGVSETAVVDGWQNRVFNCSVAGNYTGGAAGDLIPTTYQFVIAELVPTPVVHQLRLGCILTGTVATNNNIMVRNLLSVPCNEPYTALGYPPSINGSETVDGCSSLFNQTQVIDWVHVDILTATPPYDPVVSLNGLLHADHWITSTDGVSPLTFSAPPGNYRIRIAHRNHLANITDHAVPFTGASMSVSFKQFLGLGGMFYLLAPPSCGGQTSNMMKLGDVNGDGLISYVGSNNDRDPILLRVGGNVPTATAVGYYLEDVNMDGVVKYMGANNDRDLILQVIGGTTPTNVVLGQTP